MSVNWMPREATQGCGQPAEPRAAAPQNGLLDGHNTCQPKSARADHRYDALTRFFHWIFAAVIIYASVAGYTLAHMAGGAVHDFLSRLNMSISTVLIVLFPLRVVWKFVRAEPRAMPGMPGWQRLLASGVHNLIYVTIFAVLASGFLMVPNGYSFFGLIEIHTPFSKGALTDELFTVHRASCALLAGLVALHVLAVIKHQLIARNKVLQRML
ncbi:cytochrome b/b6 domain-containing protein [Paraburkholderia fungorum]|uniref:cytochrome b n=1 Tax=Paraburkholderia fungorum TaxID=134537 RepID=UPI0038B9BEFA